MYCSSITLTALLLALNSTGSVTIWNKTTAENNIGFAEKLHEKTENELRGLSRGISYKTGPAVNGIYNQNLNGKSVLIEIGGVDNTIEEVNNTMLALADILNKYIKGE